MDAREQWRKVRETDTPGSLTLGPNTFDRYIHDPKRIAFMLARYKFAAKMLRDCDSIIEIGCGDGFGTTTLLSDTKGRLITGIDFDETLIEYANTELRTALMEARSDADRIAFHAADFMTTNFGNYIGLVSLDVIEHVDPEQSRAFIQKLASTLTPDGVAVIGTPSQIASQYASAHSNLGHINLYDPDRLRAELGEHFRHVFLFSMNDEIVHTGFDRMAHYLMALCVK